MPLPRSGAPSPGQPTQVGAWEGGRGRSARGGSGAAASWATTHDPGAPKVMSAANTERMDFMPLLLLLLSLLCPYSSNTTSNSLGQYLPVKKKVPVSGR
jgi:hypothetical protein